MVEKVCMCACLYVPITYICSLWNLARFVVQFDVMTLSVAGWLLVSIILKYTAVEGSSDSFSRS
jgi:hypothetical protein